MACDRAPGVFAIVRHVVPSGHGDSKARPAVLVGPSFRPGWWNVLCVTTRPAPIRSAEPLPVGLLPTRHPDSKLYRSLTLVATQWIDPLSPISVEAAEWMLERMPWLGPEWVEQAKARTVTA